VLTGEIGSFLVLKETQLEEYHFLFTNKEMELHSLESGEFIIVDKENSFDAD
jgi:hypothetical protein